SPTIFTQNQTFIESYIVSENFVKSDTGTHQEIVSVSDTQYADTKNINITVIEINNPPVVEEIGVQTVWTNGTNSIFNKSIEVTDIESGNTTSGNLSFELTFLNGNKFFDIDNDGVMSFVANSSLIGSYNISVCATDRELDSIPENISLCNQDGLNQTTCKNFSLAITDENRAPTIISSYPSLIGSVAGTTNLYFNISKIDPDGNIPDAHWYINRNLIETDIGNPTDEFNYNFGCGVGGDYLIEAIITDGYLNDSISWPITIVKVDCPKSSSKGGGGAGRKSPEIPCYTNWVCDNWKVCQNSELSLDLGIIAGTDYRSIKKSCDSIGLFDEICGIQIRNCLDLNNCNLTSQIPDKFQSCHFTKEPDCFDEIKNCHNKACELLIDCGGPCKPCPTCSDGIKNQGEEKIDCGGPCPWKCIETVPFVKKYFKQILLIITIILVAFSVYKIRKIIKLKKELLKKPRKKHK
ncbi:hypothetical protein ACFLZF_00585, partial [Nanoarchaeota archaeon]